MEKELTLIVTSEGGEAGEGVDYAPIPVAQFGEVVTRLHANNNKQFGVYYRVGPLKRTPYMLYIDILSCVSLSNHTCSSAYNSHTPAPSHTLTPSHPHRA